MAGSPLVQFGAFSTKLDKDALSIRGAVCCQHTHTRRAHGDARTCISNAGVHIIFDMT